MAVVNAAQAAVKTVADPNAAYESLKDLWERCRAVCSGEQYVKDYDDMLDVFTFSNMLIPFSPSMTPDQYRFYKAEAELPGVTAQFAKMIVGGLLRKRPLLELPDSIPEEAYDWIMNEFGRDDSPITAFLDSALWEEVQTSRAWVFVDYPKINNPDQYSKDELKSFKPYPILQKAESIINWRVTSDAFGKSILDRVIVRGFKEEYNESEFHPTYVDTVWVHELVDGKYQIRMFQKNASTVNVPTVSGAIQNADIKTNRVQFDLKETYSNILANGEPLKIIPAWPLNGSIDLVEPMLSPIIDKEINLYNKVSRRNHLLYGAATYTPIIISDMVDEEFDNIVNSGLGSWIRLRQGDDAKVLETPTAALQDMDRAIVQSIEEMAKLGIRMLSPETEQSGVALEIRNAAQTAQLGTLNNKVSNTMAQVIIFMINWRYDLQLTTKDIEFSLSTDFNPVPIGADWLRLATEWYQQGLIPRSIWLILLKHNDLIPPDYNDEEAKQEINDDEMLMPKANEQSANQIGAENAA
jgi:hypothetical protein